MDAKKLEALRQKYAGTKGADVFDPAFAAIAAQAFSNADERKWPFAGAATFLGLPYRPELAAVPDFGGLDVALVGVPMDLGVTNRAGARLGPRAVRAVERIGPYEHALGIAPLLHLRAADVGDVPMKSRFSLDACHADIEAFFGLVRAAGVIPLAVGGDHSITYPILKALGRDRPVGMIHIDAHCDTGGTFEGSKFHHGGPFRQAVLDGALDPERSIQIGIHGGAEYLWEFSVDSGMTVLHVRGRGRNGRAGGHRKGAQGHRRRADLRDVRYRWHRPRLRAGHRHTGSGRVDATRGAGDSARHRRRADHRGRRGRSRASIRCHDQHRTGRGTDAVHRAVPDCALAEVLVGTRNVARRAAE